MASTAPSLMRCGCGERADESSATVHTTLRRGPQCRVAEAVAVLRTQSDQRSSAGLNSRTKCTCQRRTGQRLPGDSLRMDLPLQRRLQPVELDPERKFVRSERELLLEPGGLACETVRFLPRGAVCPEARVSPSGKALHLFQNGVRRLVVIARGGGRRDRGWEGRAL